MPARWRDARGRESEPERMRDGNRLCCALIDLMQSSRFPFWRVSEHYVDLATVRNSCHTLRSQYFHCHAQSTPYVERHRVSFNSGGDFARNCHPQTKICQLPYCRCARTHCGGRDVRSSTEGICNVDARPSEFLMSAMPILRQL